MPQLNSDEAANDEPTPYSEECGGEDDRWNENLSDIKGDLVEDIDKYPRGAKNNAGESSNNDRMDRADDSRDETKVPGRPYIYPPDIGSIVSSMQPFFQNGGLPPTSKVPYAYNPYHHLFYGSSAAGDIESKTGLPRGHRPDIPSMYSLPGQLGQIPHPLAPWPAPPIYPICTASTISPMLSYTNPFAAAFSSAAAAAASNMPRFPHRPGMHPTMIPHPALVSNGLGNMANGQHPHHGKHDDKPGRHSKGDSESGRSKRDRPYVKKPLNAFMLYMKEQRAKVVAECTLKESAAINQILGRKWHSLSREEQQKYYEMARKERQLHLQMYPGWSARDNYGKRKKRKKEKNQGECTDSSYHRERSYASLAHHQIYPPSPPRPPNSHYCYNLGVMPHFPDPSSHGNRNSNANNNNSNLDFPKCNSDYPECISLLDDSSCESADSGCIDAQQSMRRKKKCIRYQHDDDSDEDDFSPLNSPHQFQSYQQQNPFDPVRTTSPPLSLTSSTNGEFNSSASSSARSNHSLNASGSRPEIKQEYRASPTRGDRMSPMPNGANHDLFNGRPNGRNSSSDNSFKSENSPNNHESGNQGNHRHLGNNDNNNNNRKEHPQRQMQNFCAENGNSLRRQTSAPPIGSDHRSSFRKTNSHENSDLPGPSGLNARRNSDMPSRDSSENSPGSRTHNGGSSGSYNKGPQPSPLHPQSGGMYLAHQNGTSPLLPMSPPYSHSSHGGPFMPISPYLSSLAFPPSPLSSPVLSIFKGITQSGIGSGMGGPSSGSSHGSHSRGTPGAVVEGKS